MMAKVVSPAICRRASGSMTKRSFISLLWRRSGGRAAGIAGSAPRRCPGHCLLHGQEVLEPVLAQPVVERRPVDPQGARGVGDVPLGRVDGGDDGRPLL